MLSNINAPGEQQMTCTDARTKNTRTLAKRKNGLITATLAIATSLAFSVASHTVIAGPAHSFTEYVPVLRVEPVYRNVTILSLIHI